MNRLLLLLLIASVCWSLHDAATSSSSFRLRGPSLDSVRGYANLFVASCVGSWAQKLILHPVDTLKTRMQYERSKGAVSMMSILRRPGSARQLYRGLLPAIVGVIPVALVYMPSYEISKEKMSLLTAQSPPFVRSAAKVAAGSLAGLACSVVHVPMTIIKQRMQVGLHKSFRRAISAVLTAEGFAGFYNGWGAAALLDISSATVQFAALDNLRGVMQHLVGSRPFHSWESSVIGFLTGAFTALCTEPIDVVKTRMMTHSRQVYPTVRHTLQQMIATEGVLSLWRGLLPRIIWVSFGSAIWFSFFETTRTTLDRGRVSTP